MKAVASQKGFTLLEILLVLAVSGVLVSGILTAIFQTTRVTAQTTTQIAAYEDIRQAAFRIAKDIRMASTSNLTDGAPAVNALTLDWTIWYDSGGNLVQFGEYHRVKYALSAKRLERSYGKYLPALEPSLPILDNSFTWQSQEHKLVGYHVTDVQFSRQAQIIQLTVTSSPEDRPETSEQMTYHMYLQPKESAVR